MIYSEILYVPKYVQGRNAALEVQRILFPLGSRFLFLLGCGPIAEEVKEKITYSFSHTMEEAIQVQSPVQRARILPAAKAYDAMGKQVEYRFADVEGVQTSRKNIDALWEDVSEFAPDVVIGVGGGKAMDLARGIHHKCRCKVVLMPTSCATNAPGTRLSVVYNDEGTEIVGAEIMPEMHAAVIVDPELIIKAPPVIFASGIGDCVAAYYETVLSAQSFGTREISSTINWGIIEACGKTLFEKGVKGYYAAKAGYITNDFELCLEQIILGNGLSSSAVGALNMAHLLDEVLTKLGTDYLHGQHVGYGVIPMLVYYGRPLDEIHRYVAFARELGIPVTLKELGISVLSDERLIEAAQSAMTGPTSRFCVVKYTPEDLCKSMRAADQLVHAYLHSETAALFA